MSVVCVKFPEKCVMKVYVSTLLALREVGWVSNFQKKCYVTFKWPPRATLDSDEGCLFLSSNVLSLSALGWDFGYQAFGVDYF